MLLEVRRTTNISEWAFGDEDFNGKVVSCVQVKGWQKTLGGRILFKWSLAKFRQTRD